MNEWMGGWINHEHAYHLVQEMKQNLPGQSFSDRCSSSMDLITKLPSPGLWSDEPSSQQPTSQKLSTWTFHLVLGWIFVWYLKSRRVSHTKSNISKVISAHHGSKAELLVWGVPHSCSMAIFWSGINWGWRGKSFLTLIMYPKQSLISLFWKTHN